MTFFYYSNQKIASCDIGHCIHVSGQLIKAKKGEF